MTEEKKSDDLQRQLDLAESVHNKLIIENLNLRLKIQMTAVENLSQENAELRSILFERDSDTEEESEDEDILISSEKPVEINKKKPAPKPKPKAKSKKTNKKSTKKTKKVETE
jgi:outer membrane biosynthesis protein TonB